MNETSTAQPESTAAAEEGWEWMIVEIMGHRKHAGRVREVERFGAKQLRIDVPIKGDPVNGWETYHYSGSAIFGYMLSDEATVMKANKPYESPYRLSYRERDGGDNEQDDEGPF